MHVMSHATYRKRLCAEVVDLVAQVLYLVRGHVCCL